MESFQPIRNSQKRTKSCSLQTLTLPLYIRQFYLLFLRKFLYSTRLCVGGIMILIGPKTYWSRPTMLCIDLPSSPSRLDRTVSTFPNIVSNSHNHDIEWKNKAIAKECVIVSWLWSFLNWVRDLFISVQRMTDLQKRLLQIRMF